MCIQSLISISQLFLSSVKFNLRYLLMDNSAKILEVLLKISNTLDEIKAQGSLANSSAAPAPGIISMSEHHI